MPGMSSQIITVSVNSAEYTIPMSIYIYIYIYIISSKYIDIGDVEYFYIEYMRDFI